MKIMVMRPRFQFPSTSNFVGSIEQASVLRKFTILFLLMSVIPVSILFYLYHQMKTDGAIQFTAENLNITLIFTVIGVLVAFFAMRSMLKSFVDLSEKNKQILKKVLEADDAKTIVNENNEIVVLTRSFSKITERLEENVRSLELTKRTLHAVMEKVGQGLTQMDNIDRFLELILETITQALSGKVGVLMVVDETKKNLVVKAVYGAQLSNKDEVVFTIDVGSTLYSVMRSQEALIVPRLLDDPKDAKEHQHLFAPPLLCAPLVIQHDIKGVLSISGRNLSGSFNDDDLRLLFNVASQTAVALENAHLNQDIEQTYFETISALALAVDAKDKYSRGHLDRVARYCEAIGKRMGLDAADMKTLMDASRLHDLGKIGIPDDVLSKVGPLNDQEWLLMKKHPEIGESIIKPIRSLHNLCDIIRHHHEKLDGTGYPDGLKGDEVSSLARITAVADIYDALTSNRSYREKFSKDEACRMLKKMQGQLDQDIVDVFIEILDEEGKHKTIVIS